MKKSERNDALQILLKMTLTGSNLGYLLQAKNYSAFTKELCFGTCRYYHQLNAIALVLVPKRPKQITVWWVLLLGLYQLRVLKLPAFAVINESVKLLSTAKDSWAKALINASLRRFVTNQSEIEASLAQNLEFIYSHPGWLIDRITQDWPKYYSTILQANNQHAPMSLRVNQRHLTREDYLSHLKKHEIAASALPFAPYGIRLEQAVTVNELPGFNEGWVSIQDEAAQLAIPLLNLAPNMRVLDACAAPGGKTSNILEAEPLLDECVAIEIDPNRIKKIEENFTRLNLNARLICADASNPQSWWDNVFFDRILLDAPCSALGVIRRHPDIKILRSEDQLLKIQEIQLKLLESLWPLLKPGGLLLYATCSILPEENELQIKKFIERHSDCSIQIKECPWGIATLYGWQILPGFHNMDGFFYSLLYKTKTC